MKELIINIYMLIKSVIKAGRRRLIVVILREIGKKWKMALCGLLLICYTLVEISGVKRTQLHNGQKE